MQNISLLSISLLRTSKKEYYSKLNIKNITHNKTFWKVKIFFTG